jgi:hypothetical protein
MKKFDFKALLGLLVIAGFFAVVFILIYSPGINPTVKDILLILLGCLVTLVKDVYGYYFGSSEGSAKKTELLATSPTVSDDVPVVRGPGFGTQEGGRPDLYTPPPAIRPGLGTQEAP